MDLIMAKKLSFYDAKEILKNVEGKKMSEGKYNKFMEHIKSYLCVKWGFMTVRNDLNICACNSLIY